MNAKFNQVMAVVLGLYFTNTAIASKGNTMNSEQQNVIKTINNMTAAFHQQHIDEVMQSYTEGAVIMFEPNQAINDADEIKAMFQGAFQLNPNFTYPKGHQVVISNDTALHIAPWIMKGTAPDGQAIEQSGLSVAVLQKQDDGKWLLVIDNPHGQISAN